MRDGAELAAYSVCLARMTCLAGQLSRLNSLSKRPRGSDPGGRAAEQRTATTNAVVRRI